MMPAASRGTPPASLSGIFMAIRMPNSEPHVS
jgi:hypothetical protein